MVGAGVVLLGIAAFLYAQQPDQPGKNKRSKAQTHLDT